MHAGVGDATLMRERLAYSTFRAMGVPAVRQTPGVLHVNGNRMATEIVGDSMMMEDVGHGSWI